jgi:hypothetical protein
LEGGSCSLPFDSDWAGEMQGRSRPRIALCLNPAERVHHRNGTGEEGALTGTVRALNRRSVDDSLAALHLDAGVLIHGHQHSARVASEVV